MEMMADDELFTPSGFHFLRESSPQWRADCLRSEEKSEILKCASSTGKQGEMVDCTKGSLGVCGHRLKVRHSCGCVPAVWGRLGVDLGFCQGVTG
jgi:hypothetical protein